jgi:hypothetical protein
MCTRRLFAVTLVAVFVVSFAAMGVSAQDTPTMLACDSTLTTLLFLAERDYGYTAPMDMTGYDYGQFSGFREQWMAGMSGAAGSTTDQSGTSGDAGTTGSTDQSGQGAGTEATAEAGTTDQSGQGAGAVAGSSSTILNPGMVAGEDPNCAALRADLETFFLNNFMMGGMGGGASGGTGTGSTDQSGTSGDAGTSGSTSGDTGTTPEETPAS